MTDYLEQLWQQAGQEEWEERPVLDWLGGEGGLPVPDREAAAGEMEPGGKAEKREAAPLPRPSVPPSSGQAGDGTAYGTVTAELAAERKPGAARTDLSERGERAEKMTRSPALLEQLRMLERQSAPPAAAPTGKERGGLEELTGGIRQRAADVWNWEWERWDARALDRAFQRDSRRYDGGFFLY